jgi:hypothetical protein
MPHTFSLTETQETQFQEWRATRKKAPNTAIGGRYSFVFTPTSLGNTVKVLDTVYGDELELTDYESW